MKNICILLLLNIVLCTQCTSHVEKPIKNALLPKITVGVFDGYGGAKSCILETIAAIKLDSGMNVRSITTSDIANNVLDSINAIIIPGGSGKSQHLNLGLENIKRIKDFIAAGNGAVGICAGAYLFSNTPNYTCMELNGEQAIDIEHDNRGHGMAKFTLTQEGKKIFPELSNRDTNYVIYYEGPVFIKNEKDSLTNTVFAIMESDVHKEGNAPANMTNNKPFFLANNYGKGRVFSSIAHPEATPGMMWLIPRMVRWTLNMPLITYKTNVIQPGLFNSELLMNISDLKQEADYFQTLLRGTSEQKIAALNWLETHHSWDAKSWIQGLLYDASPNVRVRAAEYIANTQYISYLKDLKTACKKEVDNSIKEKLKIQLDKLEALLP
ncbi:MAG: BPL-N domain-containing protein [Bacteroidales bacterium]